MASYSLINVLFIYIKLLTRTVSYRRAAAVYNSFTISALISIIMPEKQLMLKEYLLDLWMNKWSNMNNKHKLVQEQQNSFQYIPSIKAEGLFQKISKIQRW